MIGQLIKWLVLPGAFGYVLMHIFTPSQDELNKIQNYSKTNDHFSAVLKAAADPRSKPIYQQKPGEMHPVPELAKKATSSNKTE